jgi:hypothetical protein
LPVKKAWLKPGTWSHGFGILRVYRNNQAKIQGSTSRISRDRAIKSKIKKVNFEWLKTAYTRKESISIPLLLSV